MCLVGVMGGGLLIETASVKQVDVLSVLWKHGCVLASGVLMCLQTSDGALPDMRWTFCLLCVWAACGC